MKGTGRGTAVRLTMSPVTAAVAAVLGSGVFAQAYGQAAPRVDVEEIVVTASRRETTVQELPFNIAALSGDVLEQQRLTNLTELGRWVPGLTVVNQGPRASSLMTVRGLNVLSMNASEFLDNSGGDSVATYLGETPVYVDFKMKDLDRVEVLIGPQGTLYGAGTLGGAVRYLPKAPDTRAFSADVGGNVYSLGHADDMGYTADASFNLPLIEDRLAFRAAVSVFDDPGFIDYPWLVRTPGVSNPEPDRNDPADVAANVYRVNDADWEQTTAARLALLWDVSDTVQATLNYYYQDQEVGGRTVNQRQAFGTGQYESGLRFLEPNDRKNDLVSLEIVADLGFAQLVSATGASSFRQLGQRDQSDLLLSFGFYDDFPEFAAFTRDESAEDRFNQELRLVSSGSGPWGWIAGLFYNELELNAISQEFTPGFMDFVDLTLPRGDLEFEQLSHQDFSEKAVFGEVSYDLTNALTVAVGGRFFEYDDFQDVSVELPIWESVTRQPNDVGDDGFLGKVNVAYDFNDDVMGYVTLSEGYRMGGINAAAPCPEPLDPNVEISCALPDEILVDPDTTTNFEVGVHSTLRDGALVVNASVYTLDWDKVQTNGVTQNGEAQIVVNGSKARSRGMELSIQARGGDRWTFRGSYAYNQSELTADAPGLVDDEDAFAGDRLSGTPEHSGSFYANYNRLLPNGFRLDAGYGFSFASDVYTRVGLRGDGEVLGGYTIHGASMSLSKDTWTATVFADNLTDKFAETSVRLAPSYIGSSPNGNFALRRYFRDVLRPRSVGVEFRYRFGE